jgi:hypothetical protein
VYADDINASGNSIHTVKKSKQSSLVTRSETALEAQEMLKILSTHSSLMNRMQAKITILR